MTRRLRVLAFVLAATLSLTACTSLPDASSPAPFDVSTPSADPIELSADGPTPESDPATLVSDFLLACAAGANDDFATARLFLSSRSAQAWNPVEQILVYDTATRPTVSIADTSATARTTATVTASAVASVDERGVLTRAEGSPIMESFDLVKESGEWRIDAPEDFFIVSQASFTAYYERVSLYFPATTGDALIPDPRWYPSRRLAAHLLSGLVEGPVAGLDGVVANAIPAGTTLPSQSIELVERSATVMLDAVLPPADAERSLLVWEVTETLLQDPAISQVSLTVSGVDLSATDLPSGPDYSLDTRIALSEEAIGTIAAATVAPFTLALHPESGASAPAMSPVSHDLVAWRQGSELIVADVDGRHASIGAAGAGAPSIDRFGYVWTPSEGTILALKSGGESLEVPLGEGNDIHTIAISPDGTRALLLRRSGEGTSVLLAAVERDESGAPSALSGLDPIADLGTQVIDVSWAGEDSFVAIRRKAGETGAEEIELAHVDLGGFLDAASAPEGAASVSAGSSEANVCVRSEHGSAHCRTGALWQDMPSALRDVRFPG